MKFICQFILFKILRWKLIGDFPDLKKYVIIVAPHTSWIDFNIAILVKYAKGLPANYIAKSSLFKWPIGFILRKTGGTPVNRSKSTNKVQAIIDIFNKNEKFVFALAPEGTRKKVTTFKTGFYNVAQGANVPLVLVALDFANKQVRVSKPYKVTDDKKADFDYFYNYFKGVKGKKPRLSIGID